MTPLNLPADLGIESACTLHQQLAVLLHHSALVHVDASTISRIHSACIQVLCAWVRARDKHGYKTVIGPVSPVLSQAAHVLGVARSLALNADGPSSTVEKTNYE